MTVREQPEKEKHELAQSAVRQLLRYIGEDPHREGLLETPGRHSRFLQEFTNPDPFKFTMFEGEGYDQMIFQGDIPFYSLCEHHLLPFFGHGYIAYIPGNHNRIVGLSKLARTLEHFSRRLQNQERITMQVEEFLHDNLKPKGVAVVLKARHMCMEMRGIRKPSTVTTTVQLSGIFKEDDAARAEFMSLVRQQPPLLPRPPET